MESMKRQIKHMGSMMRNLLARGVVALVNESFKMRNLQITVLDGEVIDNVEHTEAYGFSSACLPGAEAFTGFIGADRSHPVALIVADRRFRPTNLQPGEVVVYDDQGQEVRLTRQGIVVKGASLPITITNTRKVTVDAPQSEFTGNVLVQGNLTIAGVGKGQNGGMRLLGGLANIGGSIISNSIALENHVHGGVQAGSALTAPPAGGDGAPPESTHGSNDVHMLAAVFDNIKQQLQEEGNLDDKDRLLLCIPDIASSMAVKQEDENERQGWLYLRDMMSKWLSGEVNRDAQTDGNPFWVDWNWVMGLQWYIPIPTITSLSVAPTSPAHEYEQFINPMRVIDEAEPPANIYNTLSENFLGNILHRDGFMEDDGKAFNFIASPWTEWEAKYHTMRRVPQPLGVSGQQAALGSFTLRALAQGWTEKISDGRYRVHVTSVGVFAHDVFNFEAADVEWLGHWSCKHKDVEAPITGFAADALDLGLFEPKPGYYVLRNQDFRNYQDNHELGHDYLVLSMPHIVENFQEIVYEYPL